MIDQPPIPEDAPPFPEQYLDTYLDPDAPRFPSLGEVGEQLRQFEPTNDVEAEKLMRRLVAAHRRKTAIIAQAEELIDPIKAWRDRELAPFQRRIAWLADHLKLYAVKRRIRLGEKDPQAKTLRLPSGEVPTRRKERHVDVMNEDEFVAWAEIAAPGLLRQPDPPAPKPAKTVIKEQVQIMEKDGVLLPVLDGEVVPGLVVLDVDVAAEPKPNLSS